MNEFSLYCFIVPVWTHFFEVSLGQSYPLAMYCDGDAVMGVYCSSLE